MIWRVFVLLLTLACAFSAGAAESFHWFPALATQQGHGSTITLRGLVTEDENRPVVSWLARKLLGFSDEELTPDERARFRERTRRFLADDEGGKHIRIEIAGQRLDGGHTARNGQFTTTVFLNSGMLSASSSPQTLPVITWIDRKRLTNAVPVYAIEREGISIVSDIDDTIKISQVRDRNELVRNTFLRPFKTVDGMASVYQQWSRNSGARFHYVSGSPWQLFPVLQDFVATNNFPTGSWHLRSVRLTGVSAAELLKAPDSHKHAAITELLQRSERRKFVFVGDSGERDPEIYGELARRFPHRVQAIYIRDVTGEAAASARYANAFRGIPRETWQVFEAAHELPSILTK